MSERKGGRKPRYTSADQIKGLIDDYFKSCEGHFLQDDDGHYIMDKFGRPIAVGVRPPTVTGLALALGFTNRMDLLRYQAKKEFNEVITMAKTRVEMYAEERLFDKDGSAGARFSLACNFKNWREEKDTEGGGSGPVVKIVCDIPREAPPPRITMEDGSAAGGAGATQGEGEEVSGDASDK